MGLGWHRGGRRLDHAEPGRSHLAGGREWGLSIRIYDPELDAFRSTWTGPRNALVKTFIGHAGPGSITLEARDAAKTRWIFTDITATSFQWRNEDEDADGRIFVRQRFSAVRAQV